MARRNVAGCSQRTTIFRGANDVNSEATSAEECTGMQEGIVNVDGELDGTENELSAFSVFFTRTFLVDSDVK